MTLPQRGKRGLHRRRNDGLHRSPRHHRLWMRVCFERIQMCDCWVKSLLIRSNGQGGKTSGWRYAGEAARETARCHVFGGLW